MSLARRHRERILAAQTAAVVPENGAAHVPGADPLPASGATIASPADRAAAQIAMRLTHDLRRLKEIKAISLKVDAKKQMLPEYRDWIVGLLAADAGVGGGTSAEVAPTIMVWMIDIGEYDDALVIGEFLLRHNVPLPSRYQRDLPTLIVEEIAEAALKAQAADQPFALDVLEKLESLTEDVDMHDQVKAKLVKALGVEMLRRAEDLEVGEASRAALNQAVYYLRGAQTLHDRIGVKDKIKRADKLIAANLAASPPETEQNNEQGGDTAA